MTSPLEVITERLAALDPLRQFLRAARYVGCREVFPDFLRNTQCAMAGRSGEHGFLLLPADRRHGSTLVEMIAELGVSASPDLRSRAGGRMADFGEGSPSVIRVRDRK
jgi:hypothetical protein